MRAAIVLCVFLVFSSLQAQDFELTSINLTVQDGLAGDNVYCALQDDKGYIWFGTETGVSRYNGRVFENFYMSDGLADNEIFRIDQDSRGRIWFSALNGEFSYYYEGRFYNAQNDSALAKMRANSFYLNQFEDADQRVWFSNGYKIATMDTLGNVNTLDNSGFEKPFISSFRQIDDQVVGFSMRAEAEVAFTDHKTLEYSTRAIAKEDLPELFAEYVSKEKVYLTQFDRIAAESYLQQFMGDVTVLAGITKLQHCTQDVIWACAYNGAIRINKSTGEKRRFFESDIVTHVLKDREEGYWFTTLGKGVYYTPSLNHQSISVLQKKPLGMVTSLLSYQDKILFGGTGARFGSIEDRKVTLATEKKVEGRALTRGIIPWRDEDNFLVHAESYIIQFKGLDRIKSTLFGVKVIRKWGDELYAIGTSRELIIIDEHDLRFVLNLPDGGRAVDRLLYGEKEYFKYFNDQTGFITDIAELGSDLLIGTTKGLFRLNDKFEYSSVTEHSIMNERINDILVFEDGNYALATHGFGTFIKNKDKWIKASVEEGLASDISRKIWAQSQDTLWVATNGGVSRIAVQDPPQIANITKTDGLLTEEVYDLIVKEGALYAANSRGISIIDIKDWETEGVAPLVNLRSLVADGRMIEGDSLELAYNTSNIVLNFDGIHFRSLDRVKYEFRTVGLDAQWKPSTNSSISFGALAPGDYTFQVRTISAFGNYSDIAQITFTILTPFWLTWWFLVLMSALLIALLIWLVRAITSRNKRKALKEFDFKLRIAEAERKALQSQLNPHFIFNSLNSIQAMVLEKKPEEAYSYLEKFSKLIRRILEFSEKSMVSLNDELETLRLYMDLENLRLDGKFDYEVNVADDVSLIREIPSLITQPYVENSIWHGVMPLEGIRGKIAIGIHMQAGELVIDIVDNGVGRKEPGEGMGTRIVSDLVRKFKGDQSGEVEIQDLLEGDKPVGTKVSIRILEAVYD